MSDPSSWSSSTVGDVAILTFERRPLGTIRYCDIEDLEALLVTAAAENRRAVVLTGRNQVFVRHADLADLASTAAGRPVSGDPTSWIRALRLLDRGPFVTVAAINGQAWGGGLEIALSCSLRMMDETATLAFPEVALGIVPGVAAHRAIAALPEGRILDLLLTGRVLSASEALDWGLVTRVVPAGTSVEAAVAACEQIGGFPQTAVMAARNLVVASRDQDERERRRNQSDVWAELAALPDTIALVEAAEQRYLQGASSTEALGIPTPPDHLAKE